VFTRSSPAYSHSVFSLRPAGRNKWALSLFILFILVSGLAVSSEVIQTEPPLSVTFLKNDEYFKRLVREIRQSREEIDIAMFLFKIKGRPGNRAEVLAEELIKAAKRGVKVRLVLERSLDPNNTVTSDNRETALVLKEGGVEVGFDSLRRRSHGKLVVIDSRLTFIGSHNFTEAALKFNNEASVLIESPEYALKTRQYILSLIR